MQGGMIQVCEPYLHVFLCNIVVPVLVANIVSEKNAVSETTLGGFLNRRQTKSEE